jgi:hypothetical protein
VTSQRVLWLAERKSRKTSRAAKTPLQTTPIPMRKRAKCLANPLMTALMPEESRLQLGRQTGNKTYHVASWEGCTDSVRKGSGSGSRSVCRCPTSGSGHRCNTRRPGWRLKRDSFGTFSDYGCSRTSV